MKNKDVPESAVVKQLMTEIGKLKSEIEYLNSEVKRRDDAIAAFKKWQYKVAEYKWSYWLNEGIKLAENKPDENLHKKLLNFMGQHEYYIRFVSRMEKAYERICKSSDKLLKETKFADDSKTI